MTDRIGGAKSIHDHSSDPEGGPMLNPDAIWNETNILVVGTSGQLIERRDPAESTTPVTDAITDLDAAGGGEVYLPPGGTDDEGPLPVADNVHIYGRGHGGANASLVNITGGGKSIHLPAGDGTKRHGSIKGVRLVNADGLGGQSGGDSIAMHLGDSVRGFDFDIRFDDWANQVIRSDATCFENTWERIYANNCDAGGQSSSWLFDFDTFGPGNVFEQVIAYPTADVSGANSHILRLAHDQEADVRSLNVGGTAGWAVQTGGQVDFGPINYEPVNPPTTPDRVIHAGGLSRSTFSTVTIQGVTVNNVYNLNGPPGGTLGEVHLDNATVNGNRVYVNTDPTGTGIKYAGPVSDVNNDTGADLSEPIITLGDVTKKFSTGVGYDGGSVDSQL